MFNEFVVPTIKPFVQVDSAMCTLFLNELRSVQVEKDFSALPTESRNKIWAGPSCQCPCKCTCTCKCKFG